MKGKLTIVTDHPAMAARFVLDCYPQDLPGWIVIVTRPEDVTALPHGALVLPFWTHADDKPPLSKLLMLERKAAGTLSVGITAGQNAYLDRLIAERRAASDAHVAAPPASLSPPPAAPARPLSSRWT